MGKVPSKNLQLQSAAVLAESIPGAWLVERAWFNVSVS